MHPILTLLRKDLLNFRRNKAALVLTFIVPIALIFVFGQVFGLNRTDRGPTGIRLAVVDESDNPAAQKLVAALKAEKAFHVITDRPAASGEPARRLTEADARAMIHDRQLRFALVIPRDLFPEDGFGIRLKTLSDPRNEIETQTVNGLLQKTIFSSVPDLLGQSLQATARKAIGAPQLESFNRSIATAVAGTFGGDADEIHRSIGAGDFGFSQIAASPNSGDASAPASNPLADILQIEAIQVVGKEVKSPEATRIIAGQAIMFLLFAISGSAAGFFDEKNAGLFQRLLSAPLTRAHLLWSRFLFGVVLGIVQLVTLFATGSVLYGIDVLSHAGNLLVISLCAAAASASFGMLIAALAPNAQAASGLATFVILMMSALGGAWFPVTFMPELMQQMAKFTLVYWSIEGFLQVLWAGNTFVELLPIMGILLGIAAGVMAFSVWRLNRKNIFG